MEFVVVLFVLLVVGLGIYSWYAAAKRRKELVRWAAACGLRYRDTKDRGMDERFGGYGCLRQGSNRYAYNLLEGDWNGRDFLGFDYHYETYSTDSKGRRQTHHHHFSAVILESPIPLKPLRIRPEGFFDKVKEFFGADDIDFESAEFSRRFHVQSPDRKWAYDVIHARTMEYLLSQPARRIEFDGRHAIAWDGGTFAVPEFGAATDLLAGLFDRFPEYLVRQQQGEG